MADKKPPATPDPRPASSSEPEWELASLWSHAWRYIRWAATALIALAFLTIIGQGFLFYRVFADIHPLLGVGFVALLVSLLVVLVGRPLRAWFNTPVAASPPETVFDALAPPRTVLIQRLAYDLKFLKALIRHPDLQADRPEMRTSLDIGQSLLSEIRAAPPLADPSFVDRITAFEAEHIEARLKPLDEKVDKLIHAEAVKIGVATAVSMNGTVDAFIVLWRSANLIARISRIYFGRPNLRGSLLVMRDIAGIVVLSRALEDVTSLTGDVIGTVLGKMGGLVAGPMMDGAINAMMALKFGYLTKRRCRAFKGWRPEQASSISAGALERVQKEAGSVITELIKACGGLSGAAASAAETAMTGAGKTWESLRSWFGVRKPEGAA